MFSSWRRKIRQAHAWIDAGQLKDAFGAVVRDRLHEFQPGHDLVSRLVEALLTRTRASVNANDYPQAWEDIWQAGKLCDLAKLPEWRERVIRQKHRLVELTIEHAAVTLAEGKPTLTQRILSELSRRQIRDCRADQLSRVAESLLETDRAITAGNLTQARSEIENARSLKPELSFLEARLESLEERADHLNRLTQELKEAMLAERWSQAGELANQLLAIAPNCTLAVDARSRCDDKQIQGHGDGAVRLGETIYVGDSSAGNPPTIEDVRDQFGVGDFSLSLDKHSRSFLLWIDGVGGYLVCAGDRTMLGQAIPDSQVDVPIRGDVRRRHAMVRRSEGAHWITPLGPVAVDGSPVEQPAILKSGCRIALGDSVQLEYLQTHPLSSTARLNVCSRHRVQPWADGVLLMADSLIIGPRKNNHVVCPDWQNDLILFRREGQWFCRSGQAFEIDGVLHKSEGPLHADSRICGEDFSLSLEYVR